MAILGDGLSAKQRKAVELLATGTSNTRCAMVIGVKPGTISGWMRQDKFRAEIRLMMERTREIFEARIIGLASDSAVVVQRALSSDDIDLQMAGARLALNAAVRLANRYKELQVQGYVPPPLFVLPEGSRISTVRVAPTPPLSMPPRIVEGRVVDIKALPIETDEDDSED